MKPDCPSAALAADAEVVAAILEDAADRLRDFMPELDAARVVAAFGVYGLMRLGGYEEVLSAVPAFVARAAEGLRAGAGHV